MHGRRRVASSSCSPCSCSGRTSTARSCWVLCSRPWPVSCSSCARSETGPGRQGSSSLVVRSWRSLMTLPFYVLAALCLWLLLRSRRLVSTFEQLALLLLFAAGVAALRNMVWFSFFALIVLPFPLGRRLGEVRGKESRTVKTALAATAIAAVSIAGAAAASRPDSWLTTSVYPAAAADAVGAAAASDPTARIYSDVRYADWLLWTRHELAGRIAYDARFELLSSAELERLYRLQNKLTPQWKAAVANQRLVVLPRGQGSATARALISQAGARRIYGDHSVVVLLRPRS